MEWEYIVTVIDYTTETGQMENWKDMGQNKLMIIFIKVCGKKA